MVRGALGRGGARHKALELCPTGAMHGEDGDGEVKRESLSTQGLSTEELEDCPEKECAGESIVEDDEFVSKQ